VHGCRSCESRRSWKGTRRKQGSELAGKMARRSRDSEPIAQLSIPLVYQKLVDGEAGNHCERTRRV
jgi:hypothetical protein